GVQRLRHPGNDRYQFRLGERTARRAVPIALPGLPYPKRVDQPTEAAAEPGAPVERIIERKISEESMEPTIPAPLRLLTLTCPPMFAAAVGYEGPARFVGL